MIRQSGRGKMHTMEVAENLLPETWNGLIESLPGAHILQTGEWGQLKSSFNWQPSQYLWRNVDGEPAAGALVLERSVAFPVLPLQTRVLYVPKGPLLDWEDARLRLQVLGDLSQLARKRGAIFIKIDPDLCLAAGIPGEEGGDEITGGREVKDDLISKGWHFSDEQIQFRNSVLIDLRPEEATLLANMKQKTRYNIRLAGRKGVVVRMGGEADIDTLYRIYAETSVRDGFVIREKAYYQSLWSTFIRSGMAQPLIAEVGGDIVAALIVFRFARRAWYMYGMSTQIHREKMPNYLLQWEAMKWAKESGCESYDLWGAPDEFIESDPLWGVYRFKRGLGGGVVRYLGAWDLPVRPNLYWLYTRLLPRLLDLMRHRAKGRTREFVG